MIKKKKTNLMIGRHFLLYLHSIFSLKNRIFLMDIEHTPITNQKYKAFSIFVFE